MKLPLPVSKQIVYSVFEHDLGYILDSYNRHVNKQEIDNTVLFNIFFKMKKIFYV